MRKLLLTFLYFMTISVYAANDVNVTFLLSGTGVTKGYVKPCLLDKCASNMVSLKIKGSTVIQFGIAQAEDRVGDHAYNGIVWDSSCTKTYPVYKKRKGPIYSDTLRYPSLLSGGSLHITATSTIKDRVVHISNCRAVKK